MTEPAERESNEDPVPHTELIPDPQLPAAGDGEEPVIYRSGESDEAPIVRWDHGGVDETGDGPGEAQDALAGLPPPPRRSELQDAYDCLGIHTPLEELQAFARGRLEALVRAGEPERAQLAREAQELGLEALRRVMSGAVGKEGA